MRIRGKWQTYVAKTTNIHDGLGHSPASEIDALPMLNPAYIIQNPADKSKAWHDLLTLKHKISTLKS